MTTFKALRYSPLYALACGKRNCGNDRFRLVDRPDQPEVRLRSARKPGEVFCWTPRGWIEIAPDERIKCTSCGGTFTAQSEVEGP